MDLEKNTHNKVNNAKECEKKETSDLAEGLYKYLPTTSLLLLLSSIVLFYVAYGGHEFWIYLLVFAPAMVANGSAVLWKKALVKIYYKNKVKEDDIKPHYIHKKRLGEGKTWEGFLFGSSMGILAGLILLLLVYILRYHLDFSYPYYLLATILTSFMALIGDMAGSAIKRWRGLERGAPVPILDQVDFYLFASIGLLIIGFPLTLDKWTYFFFFVYSLHILTNCLAYSMCWKKECP
ncbi:MAG: CDP-archaeol synthase [Desulfurococcales archaeon]|nr:CDP-archaeol synthase [Desulfurococcales archaeon]